ncbi:MULTISPECIES: alpha/beta hydrolase family protein [unclassified Nesterenkonia]|uniref:alpha/beta hydrolase family protein n=1 Tax=unclassified Nesterenkonia TaxID=2629769 RepID=UPI001F4D1FFE|nr:MULTISPECIES: alpha/beta fold hydrolase [unclassified Nesterenkonia]MCH8561304.1 alpha/beta hydrolase [Nesterenkonia sp. DZ6]MCH8571236.1 alpha/beta hydrolase [Nesterenkonia sp. AY15]
MTSRLNEPGAAAARAKALLRRAAPTWTSRFRRESAVHTPWIRATTLGVGTGLAAGMTLAAAGSGLAGYFARAVVTPVRERAEDLEILAVTRGPDGDEVILPITAETVVDGTYGLFFHGGRSLARIGPITTLEPKGGTVTRPVEKVYGGDLRTAVRGWWTSVVFLNPADAGFDSDEVVITLPGGPSPAWYVAPQPLAAGLSADHQGPLSGRNVWAIGVHGRGSNRTEGIRALAATSALGAETLLISYRNDGEAPAAEDGRYGLGVTEWEDVEAAIEFALARGAQDIILFGWSMGGAICLQTADRSRYAEYIRGLVLTGPVIDWMDVLAHQAKANRIPDVVGRLGQWFISNPGGRRVTGLAAPVDLQAMNWIDRADQLRAHALIMHSVDDNIVPYGPSRDLARKNPKVTYVSFAQARHVKEWNHDPKRWDATVIDWVTDLFSRPAPGQTRPGELGYYA